MKKEKFQKLLFNTAFCLMACDGNIDEREIKEIKQMSKTAAYFQGIDLSSETDNLLMTLKEKGRLIVKTLLDEISSAELNTIQELLLLEVSLRIIYADTKVDENEIRFLKYLRSKLKVYDEVIKQRFGNVEYLFGKDYSSNIRYDDDNIFNYKYFDKENLQEISKFDFSKFKDE